MRVTFNDTESDVTIEPLVEGPKAILYDHTGRPLKRPIGFTIDNRPTAKYPHQPAAKTGKRP